MFTFKSKAPSPPPSPLMSGSWRTLDWDKRDEMKEHIRNLQISTPDVKQLRILVCGPVGAGKSSFINSIDSIFQERMTSGAKTEAMTDHSCTQRFRSHKIKDGKYGTSLSFVMCDVMGLEREDLAGAQTDDLKNILEGHIKDGYKFNTNACSDKDKIKDKDQDLKNRIHCLVNVIPADSLLWCPDRQKLSKYTTQELDEKFIEKLKTVRKHAHELNIPQIVILSRVDEACPEVKEDITRVYRSTVIQKRIKLCSANVGIPLNRIFPVKNYHEEINLNPNMDVLLLSALTTILNFANDHVAEMAERKTPLTSFKNSLTDLSRKVTMK